MPIVEIERGVPAATWWNVTLGELRIDPSAFRQAVRGRYMGPALASAVLEGILHWYGGVRVGGLLTDTVLSMAINVYTVLILFGYCRLLRVEGASFAGLFQASYLPAAALALPLLLPAIDNAWVWIALVWTLVISYGALRHGYNMTPGKAGAGVAIALVVNIAIAAMIVASQTIGASLQT